MTKVYLYNPKHINNVAAVKRAAACFGADQVICSGKRVLDTNNRLPRELRMKEYSHVTVEHENFFSFPKDVIPVAVELKEGAEMLHDFEHEENMVYVFGPEDGSIPSSILRQVHRIVAIPSSFCTNLAAAVYITLYDRRVKMIKKGLESDLTSYDIMGKYRYKAELV